MIINQGYPAWGPTGTTRCATLSRDDVVRFSGEFVDFNAVRVNPKPVRDRKLPLVIGSNSDFALARLAA